ncbi:F-box domain [Macleaya cordata]|uniref:F-box domain n=1 Tax=Macleaya cordata TaxID=56857 RepID=A0A200R867_MACCD|nr:F-box domain [Macleaya cordata]
MEINLLPKEITLDIFSRLPAESVLRCKRVCKTWQTTLNDTNYFADMHLRRQLLQLDDDDPKFHNHSDFVAGAKVGFISLIGIDLKSSSRKDVDDIGEVEEYAQLLCYGEYDENDEEEQSYKKLTLINHHPLGFNHDWVSSCNGLICLSVNHHDIFDPVYICNPITRECTYLPIFTDFRGCKRSRGGSYYDFLPKNGCMVSGFGCNLSRNEYKVVRIYYGYYDDDDKMCPPKFGCVQVYTLGGRSGWRNKGEFPYLFQNKKHGVFANGALHWIDVNERKIVAFDLADEKFRVLPSPPPFLNNDKRNIFELNVLGGCLCIGQHNIETECIYIWSFKKKKNSNCCDDHDSKVEEEEYKSWSWTKEFSINIVGEGQCSYEYRLFALTEKGQVLLRYDRSILARYDRKTATLEKFVDYGEQGMFYQTITYMNSFVSLKSLGEDAKIIGSLEEEDSKCARIATVLGEEKNYEKNCSEED